MFSGVYFACTTSAVHPGKTHLAPAGRGATMLQRGNKMGILNRTGRRMYAPDNKTGKNCHPRTLCSR